MALDHVRLFGNWMTEIHKNVLEQFLEKERCKAGITTDVLFWHLVEPINNLR